MLFPCLPYPSLPAARNGLSTATGVALKVIVPRRRWVAASGVLSRGGTRTYTSHRPQNPILMAAAVVDLTMSVSVSSTQRRAGQVRRQAAKQPQRQHRVRNSCLGSVSFVRTRFTDSTPED